MPGGADGGRREIPNGDENRMPPGRHQEKQTKVNRDKQFRRASRSTAAKRPLRACRSEPNAQGRRRSGRPGKPPDNGRLRAGIVTEWRNSAEP
jgi:hypothetical protein